MQQADMRTADTDIPLYYACFTTYTSPISPQFQFYIKDIEIFGINTVRKYVSSETHIFHTLSVCVWTNMPDALFLEIKSYSYISGTSIASPLSFGTSFKTYFILLSEVQL